MGSAYLFYTDRHSPRSGFLHVKEEGVVRVKVAAADLAGKEAATGEGEPRRFGGRPRCGLVSEHAHEGGLHLGVAQGVRGPVQPARHQGARARGWQ